MFSQKPSWSVLKKPIQYSLWMILYYLSNVVYSSVLTVSPSLLFASCSGFAENKEIVSKWAKPSSDKIIVVLERRAVSFLTPLWLLAWNTVGEMSWPLSHWGMRYQHDPTTFTGWWRGCCCLPENLTPCQSTWWFFGVVVVGNPNSSSNAQLLGWIPWSARIFFSWTECHFWHGSVVSGK